MATSKLFFAKHFLDDFIERGVRQRADQFLADKRFVFHAADDKSWRAADAERACVRHTGSDRMVLAIARHASLVRRMAVAAFSAVAINQGWRPVVNRAQTFFTRRSKETRVRTDIQTNV